MVFGRSKPSTAAATPSSPASAAAAACSELRASYHECFNRWYAEKFTKGHWHKEGCVAEWDKYRACLQQHLEDKHLRQILLESETSPYNVNFDSESSPDEGATTSK